MYLTALTIRQGRLSHPLGARSSSMGCRPAGIAISLNSSNLLHLDRSLSASRSCTPSSITALALSPSFASLAASTSQPRMFRVRPSATDLSALMPPGLSMSRSSHSILPIGQGMSHSLLSAGSSQASSYSGPNSQLSPGGSYTLGELARDLERVRRSSGGGGGERGCYSLGELGREYERITTLGNGGGSGDTLAASLSMCDELLPCLSLSPATGRRLAGEERSRRRAHFMLQPQQPVAAAGAGSSTEQCPGSGNEQDRSQTTPEL